MGYVVVIGGSVMIASKTLSGYGRLEALPRSTIPVVHDTTADDKPLDTHSRHFCALPVASPSKPDSVKSQIIGKTCRAKVCHIFAPPVFSGLQEHNELFQSASLLTVNARYVAIVFDTFPW